MKHYYYTSKKGRDITCNRCGVTVFSKRIMERRIIQGTYSSEGYEPLPDGWKLGNDEDLCPTCAKKFG